MGRPAGHLATFVHVSDLHFGELDAQTGNATLDASTEDWIQQQPWFDGYLGHSGAALRHLQLFFDRIQQDEDAQLIVTGDLTTVGGAVEFDLARRYLEAKNTFFPPLKLGLGVTTYAQRSIPGNHDHWPGRRATGPLDLVMFGRPSKPSGYPGGCPDLTTLQLAGGGRIVFIRVDSDADVHPKGSHRLFARASFRSQLKAARRLLPAPPDPREVRVLLVHHSPSCGTFHLGMSRSMRTALEDFLAQTDTRVVLSGHVHEAQADPRLPVAGRYLEARCGTTTQLDVIPPGWKVRTAPPPSNTLLVHRLTERTPGGALDWSVKTYARGRSGFIPIPNQHPASIKVWR